MGFEDEREIDDLARAALAVCDRWDADDVDDGLMEGDIGRLRQIALGVELAHAVLDEDGRTDG